MAAATLGKNGLLGAQFIPWGVGAFLLAISANAHVARRDASYIAVVVVQHFGGGKAREDVYAQGFGLFAQPATQIAEAHRVVAVVVRVSRHHPVRQLDPVGIVHQQVHFVFGDRIVQWGAQLLPVGKQLVQGARFNHRTRQDVGADFRAFFDQADRGFSALGLGQLHNATGGGQTRGATTNNNYVKLHRFACCCFGHLSSPLLILFHWICPATTQALTNQSLAPDGGKLRAIVCHSAYNDFATLFATPCATLGQQVAPTAVASSLDRKICARENGGLTLVTCGR